MTDISHKREVMDEGGRIKDEEGKGRSEGRSQKNLRFLVFAYQPTA